MKYEDIILKEIERLHTKFDDFGTRLRSLERSRAYALGIISVLSLAGSIFSSFVVNWIRELPR